MPGAYNRVELIAPIVATPEVRYDDEGTASLHFSIRYSNPDRRNESFTVSAIVTNENLVYTANSALAEGCIAHIVGELVIATFKADDRWQTETTINATHVMHLAGRVDNVDHATESLILVGTSLPRVAGKYRNQMRDVGAHSQNTPQPTTLPLKT